MAFKDDLKRAAQRTGDFVKKKYKDRVESEKKKEILRHKDKRTLLSTAESGTGLERDLAIKELRSRRLASQRPKASNTGGGFDPFAPTNVTGSQKKKKGKPFDPFASPF